MTDEIKKLNSPLERWMQKSFEDMSKDEINMIRFFSSMMVTFCVTSGGWVWDQLDGTVRPAGQYIFIMIITFLGWYYFVRYLLAKKKGLDK